jgi:uncharacterized membrane protein
LEDTVATIAALHAAHDREAHALQKAVSRATGGIARPVTLILITTAIAVWVTLNLTLPRFGHAAYDPYPFSLLSTAVSTVGLYLAAMILITQRHDDEMANRREQITLELAILSEQKSAKIIALLEVSRRNDPNQGGCSGWRYWDWRGSFYAGVAQPGWFEHYLKSFETVEINASFYSWPTVANVRAWQRGLGKKTFVYTVKVCELILM